MTANSDPEGKKEVKSESGSEKSPIMKNQLNESTRVEEKKSNRSMILVIIVLAVISICVICSLTWLGISIISTTDTAESSTESVVIEGGTNKVALIELNGVITSTETASLFGDTATITPDNTKYLIDQALEDDTVVGIIIKIESPGGEVVASDLIYQMVLEAREQKPVIAYSQTMAASGGYYIAAAADEFVTHPGAITGSIGVILQTQNLDGLYEKLGIETITFTSGPYKDDSAIYNGEQEAISIYQDIVDEYYETFIGAIAVGRDMPLEDVRELADGRIYTGVQAQKLGLVDYTGYDSTLYERVNELTGYDDYSIIEYTSEPTFFELLFSSKTTSLIEIETPISNPYTVSAYYLLYD